METMEEKYSKNSINYGITTQHTFKGLIPKGRKPNWTIIIIVHNLDICQPVMVKNHGYFTFKPKYLLNYKVLKILNGSTLLHQIAMKV